MILSAAPAPLVDAATIVGALSAFLVFAGLLSKTFVGRKVREWVTEDVEDFVAGVAERVLEDHRRELPGLLDEALAFNGTGRFRDDMRAFYQRVNAHIDHHQETS